MRFSKIFFFCGDEKKHKNGERIRYRMKERTVFLLIIIVAAIRVDKVNKWYSSLPFWNCPSNFLIFCFVSYPRSSSLGLFLHSDFCEELIYIEDTIVLENRALFQAIVLSPPAQCVKCPFLSINYKFLKSLKMGNLCIFCVKIDFFSGKRFEMFEFSHLNWSKMVISWFWFQQF